MKEVRMFMFESCPHCKKALKMMDELFEKHPEYRAVPFEMTDEKLHQEIADEYDYYYVPAFFVGGKKLHEGVPTMEAVESVFKEAML